MTPIPLGKNWSVPEDISSKVTLHYKCLGELSSKDGKFVDYKTMMNLAGVKIAPSFLKVPFPVI